MNSLQSGALKEALINILLEQARQRLEQARESYQSALEHSRSDDMKSEGKYDTRAIEAGYLASAQKQRLDQLEGDMAALNKLPASSGSKAVLGSLISAHKNEEQMWFFLAPCASPPVVIEGIKINILSLEAPLAKEFLGLEKGDVFEFEAPQGSFDFEVLGIF